LRKVEKFFEKKATGGKIGGKILIAPTKVTKPAIHDGRTFAAVLVGQDNELEKGESSRGTLGISGEQTMSVLARTEKRVTIKVGGDCMESAGAQILLNGSVERQLQLANFKQMLVSIREEATRWLGLLEMGMLRDEAKLTESPRQGQTENEVGQEGLGLMTQDQDVTKAKGKEVAHQDICGSPQITYRRRIQSKQTVQNGATTETVAETVEERQKTPMTMLEVVSELDPLGSGSGMLGNRAVRLVKIMEENRAESEGIDGVTGVLRKAREEIILHETHDSLCTSPGLAEIQKMEEQIHDGSETDLAGKYKLDSVLSVGVGEGRDEGEQRGVRV